MGSCTWGHAALQGKKWDNENFKTHLTGPRYYDTVKLPKRPRVDKFIELGRRSFLSLLCFWTTGIQQLHGTSPLSPHINGSEAQWHTAKIAVTHWTGSPQHGGWEHPWHPRCPSSRNETQPYLTHVLDQQRGVPWKEGCHGWFGSLGAAAAISRACSLPDPLHLTHFLFFTHCLQTIGCQSDPHQNIYNYLPSPAPQHGPVRAAPSQSVHTWATCNSSVAKTALTWEVG